MSVNYSKLHSVDMPVTDLDDQDEDFALDEHHHHQNQRQQFDPLEGLDYEVEDTHDEAGNGLGSSGIFGSVRNTFNSAEERIRLVFNGGYGQPPSYEDSERAPESSVEYWASKVRNAGRSFGDTLRGSLHRTNTFELRDMSNDNDDLYADVPNNKNLITGERSWKEKGLWGVLIFAMSGMLFFLVKFGNPLARQEEYHRTHTINKVVLSNTTHDFHKTTILVSLDGFHPHYINSKLTPTLHNMLLHDYGAPYMIPSFPSSTFPNHWTLVTGLHPSEHGIVGNTFYDPVLDKQFVNTDKTRGALDPEFWQGGEPLWETAYKQGVNSAIHMWPGSEVPGIGFENGPEFVDAYNGSELLSAKVERVMTWLDIEKIEERPELILSYVPTIDTFGHKYGISGPELEKALTYVDDFIDLLLLELKKRNLQDIANVIVVSDHGMAPTSNDRLLYLDDLIDLNNEIEHIDGWPLFGLRPKETGSKAEEAIIEEFNKNIPDDLKDHFQIYKVDELPEEWQFGGALEDHKFNYRLAPIWVIPHVGYAVTTHKQMKDNNYDYKPKGVHGYNNTELLMRAVFLGRGPYFDTKLENSANMKRILPFQNTEVYNLICDTLDMKPSPNNGTFGTGKTAPGETLHSQTLLSFINLLPEDWLDELEYPNLPFEVDHVVEDATYDFLWKKPSRIQPTTVSVSTNTNPASSLKLEASNIAEVSEHIPKPTDLTGEAEPTSKPADDGDNPSKGSIGESEGHSFWGGISEGFNDLGEHLDNIFGDVVDGVENIFDDLFDGGHGRRRI
ncbi:ectonucleotide pyrophosphatase/phosphodiesterase 1 [[Candida] railenensis]|uniref:Ectonucleotide pyrophosphatase/phosphodiesterase 1 n=1 Tax=[Candida] railenensis TaxID=45579 RepID=A0A9P0W0G1_9ASCO|nr:ectonucleotide pyrophosphatase/phosphodiesterase 1 [[Candida] railenensis]